MCVVTVPPKQRENCHHIFQPARRLSRSQQVFTGERAIFPSMSTAPGRKFTTDKRLSLKARGLLALCLTCKARVTRDWIAARCREGRRSILAALVELEALKYAWRGIQRDRLGRVCGDQWRFVPEPRKALPPGSTLRHRRIMCRPATGEHILPSPDNVSPGASKVIDLWGDSESEKKTLP